MTVRSRRSAIAAGLALVALPVAALILKLSVFPGWMMLIIAMAGLPLIAGYVLQIVIAVRGMFRPVGVFNTMPDYKRGLTAAWLTSLTGLLSIFFLVDGGDGGEYGSAFTMILGNSSTPEGERISMILCLICAVVWIASWVWLVVEWIVLSARARRATRQRSLPPASTAA